MIELPHKEFGMVCFIALMQSGDGLMDKHPSYIQEKLSMVEEGYDAFQMLDLFNMRRVAQWCDEWGVLLPKGQREYLRDNEKAYSELQSKGFTFE